MKHPTYKPLPAKKLPKNDREQAVLLGLIDLYLKSGKPIGSSTLQENGFESLSPATIRNYFSKMESQGLLKQPHTSGGRLPTEKAFRLYAAVYQQQGTIEKGQQEALERALQGEGREVTAVVHQAAEALSELSKCAVFISTPRFDHDFIRDVRLIELDPSRLLVIVMTDFGLIRTEILYIEHPTDSAFLRNAESYFLWRTNKGDKPPFHNESDAKLAQKIYNEILVRHVVGYTNFLQEDVVCTGLSKLLSYPEFNDVAALVSSLALLEDENQMRYLLKHCLKNNTLTYWIGDELCPAILPGSECSVIAIPYRIGQTAAGAIALLGPMRIPYRNLFGLMAALSEQINRALTEKVYKHKITFRQPARNTELHKANNSILLEDQSR
ncbi:MAG: heat-inducible transcriptional repressor HrcA [Chlamydiia bacterium]|nr:heat-inducible transcriptional repressor HrcA [Chlamydiia bacterium]